MMRHVVTRSLRLATND